MSKTITIEIEIENPEKVMGLLLNAIGDAEWQDGMGQAIWTEEEAYAGEETMYDSSRAVWDIYKQIKEKL